MRRKPEPSDHDRVSNVRLAATVAAVTLCASFAGALDFYWDAGGSDDTFTNATNWEGDAGPSSADNAYIGANGHLTSATGIIDSAVSVTALEVGWRYPAYGKVTVTGATASLTCSGTLHLGNAAGSSYGMADFVQYGGTVDVAVLIIRAKNASLPRPSNYRLVDGVLDSGNGHMYNTGRFELVGGTATLANAILFTGVAESYPPATTIVENAYVQMNWHVYVGYNAGYDRGVFIQNGGSVRPFGSIYIGLGIPGDDSLGTYTMNGGTITLGNGSSTRRIIVGQGGEGHGVFNLNYGDPAGTGTIVNVGGIYTHLRVNYNNAGGSGAFQGHGDVPLRGSLDSSGRVIAYGAGADNTLDMSSFTLITNSTDNVTSNGWFAENHGKLMLPTITVAGGGSTRNWGEHDGDTTIDMVNSVRMVFSGVTGGDLDVALLATNRTDVTVTASTVVGLWDFDDTGGFAFGGGNAALTFRYDDALAAALGVSEGDLKVWHDRGEGRWTDITASIDTGANTITSDPVTAFSKFAVSEDRPVPPAGTMVTVL